MFKIVIMYFIMYNIDFFPLKIILLKVTFLWFYFNYNNSRIVLILYFTDEADVYHVVCHHFLMKRHETFMKPPVPEDMNTEIFFLVNFQHYAEVTQGL